jgi:hypothetical protein
MTFCVPYAARGPPVGHPFSEVIFNIYHMKIGDF